MKHTAEEVRYQVEESETLKPAERKMLNSYADMIERAEKGVTDEVVERAAKAIAEDVVGREWGDLPELYVNQLDQGDLLDYARAALLAVRPLVPVQADESAVPFGYVSRNMSPFRSSTPAWQFSLTKVEPHGCIEAMPLFTHPPAQAAQAGISLSDALNALENAAVNGVRLYDDDLGRFRATADRIVSAAEPVVPSGDENIGQEILDRLDDMAARDAEPRAVLDEWEEAYAAFKGAFDTPLSWRRDNSDYANDARDRLRAFNDKMLTNTQTTTKEMDPPSYLPDGWIKEARKLYDQVKVFPEKNGDPREVGSTGFMQLLELRNHVEKLLAAAPSPSEFTTPDCPVCGCVDDGQCLCDKSPEVGS